ncbi:hypothetical protein BABINDRAFT_13818 [Babjeviella inositovora NRRL Y-12698]|uniref:Alcohol acetyltransferase n=1 Tax=Babjeviella inositovora NRRL Y-12698 TaxID=984486 RepID=A0A1E3QP48_9ASCO|nr:uncharacterized protein BABINDRAFT_13818 [Babjeviella inositovora NRRL Y-12698]ODQ79486.1 hypothetical protein BABINDRAFT_13818 [Babjeviella inositovora NRRL Y-12698]
MTSAKFSRSLTSTEHFFRTRSITQFYSNFQMATTYSQPVNDLSLLYRALRKTLIDYPILLTNVFDRDGADGAYSIFKVIEQPLKFSDVVFVRPGASEEQSPDKELRAIAGDIPRVSEKFMKEIYKTRFTLNLEDQILLQVHVVDQFTLCFVFEHIYADGLPGVFFNELFIENLAYISDSKNDEDYAQKYGYLGGCDRDIHSDAILFDFKTDQGLIVNSLPPPIDNYLPPLHLDYANGDPNFFDKQVPLSVSSDRLKKWPGLFPKAGNFSLVQKLVNITTEDTDRIVANCRSHQVSLTSFLKVVHSLTLYPLFGDEYYTTQRVAVNLRRHLYKLKADDLPLDDEILPYLNDPKLKFWGCCAHAGLPEPMAPIKSFSWEIVQKIHGHLQETIVNNKLNHTFTDFKEHKDAGRDVEFFTRGLKKPRPDAVKISNLGLVKTPVYEVGPEATPWTIEDVVFTQDTGVLGADFVLSMLSTRKGGLNIVETYIDHYEPDEESAAKYKHLTGDNLDWISVNFRKNILENYHPPAPSFLSKDYLSLSGKMVIVTSGNSSVDLEAVKLLGVTGAKIYIFFRNEASTLQAIEDIKKTIKNADMHFVKVDLSDLIAIKPASEELLARESRLDLAIHNAGTYDDPTENQPSSRESKLRLPVTSE